MRVYKLTNANGTTRGGLLWGKNVEHSVKWGGKLCEAGCLHGYSSPYLAVLMDPVHGRFGPDAMLWEAEAEILIDDGTKIGTDKIRTIRRIPLPRASIEVRVTFAVLTALTIYTADGFVSWAEAWLSGKDRSKEAARKTAAKAATAKWAAEVTAAEAEVTAAEAAARAAEAAAWAAEAARAAEAAAWAAARAARAADAAAWAAEAAAWAAAMAARAAATAAWAAEAGGVDLAVLAERAFRKSR